MEYSYKFRIYPTKAQMVQIQRTFGCCRFVYNYYLAKRIDAYKTDKRTLNYNACSADMTVLKKTLPWLAEVDSTALQSSLKDLDTAYKNFFRSLKGNGKHGFPCFKSKRDLHRSYKFLTVQFSFQSSVESNAASAVRSKVEFSLLQCPRIPVESTSLHSVVLM